MKKSLNRVFLNFFIFYILLVNPIKTPFLLYILYCKIRC